MNLLDGARPAVPYVRQSGVRLSRAGMAMPGTSLARRIRQILEGSSVPHISRTRMACVCVACAISCAAIAAGTLDRAQANSSADRSTIPHESESAFGAHPVTNSYSASSKSRVIFMIGME